MESIPKIEIRQKGIRARILIDGKELRGVRGFSIEQKGGQTPTLRLDLLAADMTVDAACIPALPDVFKEWYTEIDDGQKQESGSPICID